MTQVFLCGRDIAETYCTCLAVLQPFPPKLSQLLPLFSLLRVFQSSRVHDKQASSIVWVVRVKSRYFPCGLDGNPCLAQSCYYHSNHLGPTIVHPAGIPFFK